MSDHREISIIDLIRISKKLIESNFTNHDFYSLLGLAVVTVNEYSRVKRHINTGTRIDLSIAFIPDLIQYLHDKKIISDDMTASLKQSYKDKLKELPMIIRAYYNVAVSLRPKIDPRNKKNSWDCAIQ